MPQRILSLFDHVFILLLIGAAVPVGHALACTRLPPWRVTLGRALVSAIFTLSAGVVLMWLPDLPQLGLFALAGLIASLGQSGIERWAREALRRRGVFKGDK